MISSLFALVLAQACSPGNLLAGKPMEANAVRGGEQTANETLLPEGTLWDAPGAAVFSHDGRLVIDLLGRHEISHLVLQADNDDRYLVEGSLDGQSWEPVWIAPPISAGSGLRLRATVLSSPAGLRYLSVRGQDGDGNYSVSALRAYCSAPSEWPPAAIVQAEPHGWAAINNEAMVTIKGLVALAGTLLLVWGIVLRRRGRAEAHRRLRDLFLAGLGMLSFACWWNLGHFHFDRYLHVWEQYHYYIGAKYSRELEYTRLYQCTSAAEIELGSRDEVASRRIRDLTTNEIHDNSDILADTTLCSRNFSPERWNQFKKDIAWFRTQFSSDFWRNSQIDHGFNATPVWTIVGGALANLAPASDAQIAILAALDP